MTPTLLSTRTLALLCVLAAAAERLAGQSELAAVCSIKTDERVVAVGDVHGAFDGLASILREAGLIDNRQRWIGGKALLVQTGDVLDRGPDSRKALDLLRALEVQAVKAGGRVIALLGNHEVMRLMNYTRDTSEGEYRAFRTPDSDGLRQRALDFLKEENAKVSRATGTPFNHIEFERSFLLTHPLGAVEMQIAFGPEGDYGRWLRQRNAMAQINGVAFLHGGLTPQYAALGCEKINATIRAEVNESPFPDQTKALSTIPDGPLWYRGLVDDGAQPGPADPEGIEAALKSLNVQAIVLGHTASAPDYLIRASANGRIIQIDTGMLGGTFFSGGRPSALELAGGTFTAIYQGKREVIRRR